MLLAAKKNVCSTAAATGEILGPARSQNLRTAFVITNHCVHSRAFMPHFPQAYPPRRHDLTSELSSSGVYFSEPSQLNQHFAI
eukprot:3527459-Amphidinium_carterae.1